MELLTVLTGDVSTFALAHGPRGIVMYHREKEFFVTNIKAHTITKITSSGCF